MIKVKGNKSQALFFKNNSYYFKNNRTRFNLFSVEEYNKGAVLVLSIIFILSKMLHLGLQDHLWEWHSLWRYDATVCLTIDVHQVQSKV